MFLRAVCGLVLVCILVAGLWPFHAPRNEVTWLSQRSGVLFGKYGSIVSAGEFKSDPRRDGSCSLEIWLEPKGVHSSGTILAFYQPERQFVPLVLRQSLGDLEILRASQDEAGNTRKFKTYVDDIFSQHKLVLVVINSNQSSTTVFLDGVFVKKFDNSKFSSQALTGRLIIGNSPVTTDEWSGQVRGLAVYDRTLTADQVSRHFASWKNSAYPDPVQSEGAVALFPFNEGHGDVVHNLVDSATDLIIPNRFFLLHGQFLERPWDEYRPDWNYWKDVGVNVAGFIPFGFFFYAFFSRLRGASHPVAITIALGFAVSLIIEVLQAFLPTRDSGMTDLITNTLGTAIGVMVFRPKALQAVLAMTRPRAVAANV